MLLLGTTGQTQTPTPQQNAQAASAAASATIKQYCVGCHSAALKTGGVVLDPNSLNQVANNAETWERAIRQLRAKSMPPVPMPRPDAATYDRVATYLETELDRAANAKPNPGDLPTLHRLTRTEYHNAIRDLLAIDDLPKEMDYTLLLPSDNAASGFDNIADLLYVSPATMERYLDASTKISRLAVGDPAMPVMVNIYRTPLEGPQDSQLEDLSFGTRGGTAIRSYFPSMANTNSMSNWPAKPATSISWKLPSMVNVRKSLPSVGMLDGAGAQPLVLSLAPVLARVLLLLALVVLLLALVVVLVALVLPPVAVAVEVGAVPPPISASP